MGKGKGKGKGLRERSSPQKAKTRKMPKQRRFQVQKLKPTIPTTNAQLVCVNYSNNFFNLAFYPISFTLPLSKKEGSKSKNNCNNRMTGELQLLFLCSPRKKKKKSLASYRASPPQGGASEFWHARHWGVKMDRNKGSTKRSGLIWSVLHVLCVLHPLMLLPFIHVLRCHSHSIGLGTRAFNK